MSTLNVEARRTGGGSGNLVDFDATLGVDPTEPAPALDGFVRIRRICMELGYVRSDLGGKAQLTEDLNFDGERYSAGDRLFTKLESVRKRLVFGYDILGSKQLTLGAGCRHFQPEHLRYRRLSRPAPVPRLRDPRERRGDAPE